MQINQILATWVSPRLALPLGHCGGGRWACAELVLVRGGGVMSGQEGERGVGAQSLGLLGVVSFSGGAARIRPPLPGPDYLKG